MKKIRLFSAILVVLMIVSLMAVSCDDSAGSDKSNVLVGSWGTEQEGVPLTLSFKNNGTFTMNYDLSALAAAFGVDVSELGGMGPSNISGTYKITGENTVELTMTVDGESDTEEAEFEVKGNTLILDGMELTRK